MATEKRLGRKLRRAWPGFYARIEASEGGVDPGFPDTTVAWTGQAIFVELKTWPEELRETQLPWHIWANQEGALALVLCELPGKDAYWLGKAEVYERLLLEGRRPHDQTIGMVQVVGKLMQACTTGHLR